MALRALQYKFYTDNLDWLDSLSREWAAHTADFNGSYLEGLLHHDDPHVKRALRRAAWMAMQAFTVSAWKTWTEILFVRYKMKTDEIAKILKYPRAIGDLGVSLSLRAMISMALLKRAQSLCSQIDELNTYNIVKSADVTQLVQCFSKLINPVGERYISIFSDDACMVIQQEDGTYKRWNGDIKSCDSSHYSSFAAFYRAAPANLKHDVLKLIHQLLLPIKISDTTDATMKVKIKAKVARLLSGSGLTTAINSFAFLSIYKSIVVRGARTEAEIHAAARAAGWLITLEAVEDYSDFQFLKHTPIYDTLGTLRALFNLGPFARGSGESRGDFPGRGTIPHRSRMYQYALLRGMYPRVSSPLIEALKDATGRPTVSKHTERTVTNLLRYTTNSSKETYEVTDQEMLRRYKLSDSEFNFITGSWAHGKTGDYFNHESLDKVLQVDYGLKCKDRESDFVMGTHELR